MNNIIQSAMLLMVPFADFVEKYIRAINLKMIPGSFKLRNYNLLSLVDEIINYIL